MTMGVLRRSITRLGVLTALGAVTLVVPLTGFVGTDTSLALTGRAISVADEQSTSWADTGLTGGRQVDPNAVNNEDSALVPESLAASDGVVARARIHEAASTGCTPADKTAARGDMHAMAAFGEDAIVYPLASGSYQIVSPFGYRMHPIYGIGRLHAGVDMAAPAMTPVHAAARGVVKEIGTSGGAGHHIIIRHTDVDGKNFDTNYYHLTIGSEVVKVGDVVEAGQHIAGVGSTGASTGSHLHFEVHPNYGEPVDPIHWLKENGAQPLGETIC